MRRNVIALAIISLVILAGCTAPRLTALPRLTAFDSPLAPVENPLPPEEGINMDAELLASIAGIILSLVFSYIPGVNDWFETLEAKYKQAIMGGLLIVVAGAIFGLSCGNVIDTVACTQEGAKEAFMVLIDALVANQAVYLLTRKAT